MPALVVPAHPERDWSGTTSMSITGDPFSYAMRPPTGETEQQRSMREEKEQAARAVSDAIDEALRVERANEKKKRTVKLLLLGQSESGKSTTLRQFQRLYTPTAFREERTLWRSVIHLNLARSIRIILDALSAVQSAQLAQLTLHEQHLRDRDQYQNDEAFSLSLSDNDDLGAIGESFFTDGIVEGRDPEDRRRKRRRPTLPGGSGSYVNVNATLTTGRRDHRDRDREREREREDLDFHIPISAELEMLKLRLEPLRHVESMLISKLAPPDEDEATRLFVVGNVPAPGPASSRGSRSQPGSSSSMEPEMRAHAQGFGFGYGAGTSPTGPESGSGSGSGLTTVVGSPNTNANTNAANGKIGQGRDQEVFVRSGYSWKHHMARLQSLSTTSPSPSTHPHLNGTAHSASRFSPNSYHSSRPNSSDPAYQGNKTDYVTELFHSCRGDLVQLWRDPAVKEILRRRKVKLEESPGFFLDHVERIAAIDYEPSDDDVLRARLKTVGVTENRFEMEAAAGRESGIEWKIYDVGGTRSQVPTWVPFFDDVNAIIFLAPISGFDQTLVEDRSVNRLEDSVFLWKAICSNKLLAKVELVLFLNKCDILSQKLRSGVRLAKYVRSYGDRPNDVDSASQYFRGKFAAIQREYSPQPRRFYGYCTSVTDSTTTSGILASVRDMIVREHLRQSRLI